MARKQPVPFLKLSQTVSRFTWTQRRGRPGITPEFPVCRPEQLPAIGHQQRAEECTGNADSVKHGRAVSHNR